MALWLTHEDLQWLAQKRILATNQSYASRFPQQLQSDLQERVTSLDHQFNGLQHANYDPKQSINRQDTQWLTKMRHFEKQNGRHDAHGMSIAHGIHGHDLQANEGPAQLRRESEEQIESSDNGTAEFMSAKSFKSESDAASSEREKATRIQKRLYKGSTDHFSVQAVHKLLPYKLDDCLQDMGGSVFGEGLWLVHNPVDANEGRPEVIRHSCKVVVYREPFR